MPTVSSFYQITNIGQKFARSIFLVAVFALVFLFGAKAADAAAITWDGGGSGNDWSTCANWSSDTCPGAGDVATFNGTSTKDSTIDESYAGTVQGIDINAGYTGTITNSRTTVLTIGIGNFAQDTAIFAGGTGNIDLNGTFTLAGGTFTSTQGNLNVSGHWTHTAGGSFDGNSGTVIFDGSAATLDFSTSETFYSVQLNKTGGNGITISSGDTLITTNSLLLTDGFIDTGALNAQGSVTVTSGFDGGFYSGLTFSGGNTQTFTLTGGEGLIDKDITVNKSGGSVNLASTLTMDAASQDLLIVEGVFNANGQALTVSGSSGTFVVQDGGTFAFNGDETLTIPSSTPTIQSGSTILYNDTSGTRAIKDWAYHHLTISGSGGTFTLGANESIAGDFTATAGTFDAADYTMTIAGNTVINGGTVMTGTNTFTFGDAAGDSVTISSGDLRIEANNMGADIQKNAGTWTNSGGTITYAGSTVVGAIITSISPYFNLAIDGSGSAYDLGSDNITVNGSVTITTGTFDATAGAPRTVTVAGSWTDTGAGVFTEADSTVTFTGTGTINANETFNNVTINSSGTVTLGAALDVADTLTLTAGTLDVSGSNYVITAKSWADAGDGAFTEGTGTVTFDIAGGTISSNEAFYSLTIDHAGTTTLGTALDVDNALTITSGTLDVSGSNYGITVGGNWSKTGSFTSRAGTVTFDDATKTSIVSGSTSFYNLSSTTASKAITFTAGTTQTVTGLLTLTGASGQLIVLRSSSDDSSWALTVSGTSSVDYVSVRDSNAGGGNAITHAVSPSRSVDVANNVNWGFNVAPTVATITGVQGIDGTGRVTVTFIMDDADDDDTLQAKIEYSNDGGSTWFDPTVSTTGADTSATYGDPSVDNTQTYQVGQAGAYITSSSGANTVSIIWLSATDLPAGNISNAQIRVTPYDGTEAGSASTNSNFILDNVDPTTPGTFANTVAGSSTATFTWSISTETNFNHYELWYGTNQVDVQGRSGTAVEWDNDPNDATLATRTTATTTLTGLTTGNTYYTLICSQDNYGNEGCASDISFATNTAPTVATVTGTQGTDGTGRVTVTFIMDDVDDDDTLQAKIEYSTNGGSSWADPTISTTGADTSATYGDPSVDNAAVTYQVGQTGAFITSSSGANTVTIIWQAATDVSASTDISNAQIRVTPYDGTVAGSASSSSDFVLDVVDPASLASFTNSSTQLVSVTLSWTAATETNFDHYEVWYGTSQSDVQGRTGTATEWDNSDDATLATASTALTTINSDPRNKYFKIWSIDDYGNSSTLSDIFVTLTASSPETIGKPTGFSVANTSGGVLLTWEDPANDDSKYIQILRGVSPLPVNGTPIATVAVGTEYYIDTDVSDGEVITYVLRAKGNSDTGDLTEELTITVDLSPNVVGVDPGEGNGDGGGGGDDDDDDETDDEDLPDLLIEAISMVDTDTIAFDIANDGMALTSDYSMFAYVYVNDELQNAVKISDIGKQYTVSSLKGESGTVEVKVCVDVSNEIAEFDEDNNCATETFLIEATEVVENVFDQLGLNVPEHWSKGYLKNLSLDDRILDEAVSTSTFFDMLMGMFNDPDQGMNRGETLEFLLTLAGYEVTTYTVQTFSDVTSAHERGYLIEFAARNGLVNGYPDGTFQPERVVNRAEALKIAAYFFGLDVDDNLKGDDLLAAYGLEANPFSDVDIEAWYAPFIIHAYSHGVVSGYGNGTFGPGNEVTYAEFLKIATLMQDIENAVELASEFE